MPTNPYSNTEKINAVIKVRRGPEVDRTQLTYEDGELIYSTDKKRLFVGDGVNEEGTDGGNLVGNKLWISDSFNSEQLPYIQKYDLVYRPNTTGFYILTGNSVVDPKSYILVGGKELIPQVLTYTIPKASDTTLGGVIVKTGLTVDPNGNLNVDYDTNTLTLVGNKLSVVAGAGGTTGTTIGNASYAGYGTVRIVENTGLNIDNGNLSVSIDNKTIKLTAVDGADQLYVNSSELTISNLVKATSTTLGAIVVSDGLKINDSTGELSLKTATSGTIGGIKTGYGLSANSSTSELDVLVDNETIQINGDNKLEVKYPNGNDGDVLMYQNSTNSWIASGGFTSSLRLSGYQKLPGGLIMQWGGIPNANGLGGLVPQTFPIPFTTSVFQVVVGDYSDNTDTGGNDGSNSAIRYSSITTTGFSVNCRSSPNWGFSWYAIGI
jgi:hypothetical protein